MKKLLLLFALSLFASSTFAGHVIGGDITWEKTMNGQFIIELKVYRECGNGAAGTGTSQSVAGPIGTINVNLVSQVDISPICSGAGQVSCGSSSMGMGAVEMMTYRSSAITLPGTPPATGWDFTWSICCFPNTVVNMSGSSASAYAKSTMYSGVSASSPYFVVSPNQVLTNTNKTYSIHAMSDNSQDSIYHGFSGASLGYATGYSSSSPFPSSLTNASNGAVSIDGSTGLISYDIQTATNGLYLLEGQVEQWRSGTLISRVHRSFGVMYTGSSGTNTAPTTHIDTSTHKQVRQLSDYAYKAFVTVGDTLEFVVSSSDADFNQSTFLPQQIAFHALGSSLDTSFGPQGIHGGAKLNPVAPQVGYIKSLNNNIKFSWVVTNAHFNSSNNSHFFDFVMKDDHCPYPGVSNVTLQVVVRKAVSIASDTASVCAGDSVQLNGYIKSGNYSWSPAVGLSDPTAVSPMASPSASGYYYLTDPTTNEMDSVYVEITTPAAFTLAQSGSYIELTDANPATSTMWYYNGVPFYYPHDTLPILGYGDYWVKGAVGPCVLFSDTVNINSGSSFSVSDPSMGSYNGTNLPVAGSHGMTFSISQTASLQSVSIPGLVDLFAKKSSGYDLNLKIYDANQTEVYSTDVTLQRPMDGLLTLPVGYSLSANVDYTIAISGDSAYTFSMFENVSYPMSPFHNGITVKGSYEGSFEQFPTMPSSYLLPFSLNTDAQVVSLNENDAPSFRVYPNPAANRFTIEGLSGDSEVQILNVNGKLVSTISTKESSIVIERGALAAGMYFVKITDSNTTSLQKVMFD